MPQMGRIVFSGPNRFAPEMPKPPKPITLADGEPFTPQLAFGIVLRRERLVRGLKQKDLEDDDKLVRTYISKLERGERQPNLLTIIHLAKCLDMEPEELVRETMKLISEHRGT